MAATQSLLRFCRKTHLYVGVFISPALLFFAFTGAMQTLSLHEAAGSDYKPPTWLAELGQLHKNQTPVIPPRRSPEPGSGARPKPATPPIGPAENTGRPDHRHDAPAPPAMQPAGPSATASAPSPAVTPQRVVTLAGKQKEHLPMKIFFLVVTLGLFTSTLTGLYMAYKYERGKVLVSCILLLGLAVPLVLLRF